MPMYKTRKIFHAVALCSAVLFVPTIAVTQDKPDPGAKAIKARQGFMQLVVWNAGPLFGMAKGEVAYDASVAAANAANMKALSQYSFSGLFLDGTSKDDRPGKTRALSDIWADKSKFEQAYKDFGAAVAVVGD